MAGSHTGDEQEAPAPGVHHPRSAGGSGPTTHGAAVGCRATTRIHHHGYSQDRGSDCGAKEEAMLKSYRKWQILSLGLLAGLAGTTAAQWAMAASPPPDFSPAAQTAWVGIGIGALLPVPGSPKPVGQDPAHPYVSNDESRATGQQPTQRISDIGNPNLKQWAKDVMKKEVTFTADDPDTYFEPWTGTRRYRRVERQFIEDADSDEAARVN